MSVIRYPGSKEKLVTPIWTRFPDAMKHELWSNNLRWEYREPFFGAGAVGIQVIERLSVGVDVWLNDIDFGMVCLWRTIACSDQAAFDLFNRMIDAFEPSADYFYRFKEEDGRRDLPEVQVGFRKLALHRMSFSGLGYMAGGPIGGRDQENAKYDVQCRWKPGPIKKAIAKARKVFRRGFNDFRITCLDFADVIRDAPSACFIYADPPYFEKGPQLYRHSFSDTDHRRLADALRTTRARWALSYDDAPFIRDLYRGWTDVEPLEITYTTARATGDRRPKNREILITPFPRVGDGR
jgi:DNA adenine methylase